MAAAVTGPGRLLLLALEALLPLPPPPLLPTTRVPLGEGEALGEGEGEGEAGREAAALGVALEEGVGESVGLGLGRGAADTSRDSVCPPAEKAVAKHVPFNGSSSSLSGGPAQGCAEYRPTCSTASRTISTLVT